MMMHTAAPGPGQPVNYRQGVIISFDPITLENTVLVGTTVLENLQLLAVSEAAILVPGSVVGIMVVGSMWAILGRLVTPGTDEANDATSLLSSWTYSASVDTQEFISTTSYTDLATVGPSVIVPVRNTGRLLVMISMQLGWAITAASPPVGGSATIEMAGANVMSTATASNFLSARDYLQVVGTVTNVSRVSNPSEQRPFDGLNSGDTTITMKYRALASGNLVDFSRRTLTVITL